MDAGNRFVSARGYARVTNVRSCPLGWETEAFLRRGGGKHLVSLGALPLHPGFGAVCGAVEGVPLEISGCRGSAPALAGCQQVPERRIAAISRHWWKTWREETRGAVMGQGAAPARVHAKQRTVAANETSNRDGGRNALPTQMRSRLISLGASIHAVRVETVASIILP